MHGMMVAPSHRVRRRRRRSSGPRRLRMLFAALVAIGALVAGGWLLEHPISEPTDSPQSEGSIPDAIADNVPASADRPTYKHSVIPGGVRDQRDLAGAIERDPVVAQHYRDLDATTMQRETLSAD